jgi:hypothetical protein
MSRPFTDLTLDFGYCATVTLVRWVTYIHWTLATLSNVGPVHTAPVTDISAHGRQCVG